MRSPGTASRRTRISKAGTAADGSGPRSRAAGWCQRNATRSPRRLSAGDHQRCRLRLSQPVPAWPAHPPIDARPFHPRHPWASHDTSSGRRRGPSLLFAGISSVAVTCCHRRTPVSGTWPFRGVSVARGGGTDRESGHPRGRSQPPFRPVRVCSEKSGRRDSNPQPPPWQFRQRGARPVPRLRR